jgi:hypothetical protein
MKQLTIITIMALMSLTATAQKVNYAVNRSTGLLSHLSIKGDLYRMNWMQVYADTLDPMHKAYRWGASVNMKKRDPENPVKITNSVKHWNIDYDVFEEYTIKNESKVPYDLSNLRITLPFNSNPDVGSSKHQRCDLTVSIGEGSRDYIKAVRQSGKPNHLGLIVQKGKLGRYEMLEVEKPSGNSNGRYILCVYPESYILKPGKSYTLKWCIFSFEDEEDFQKDIKHRGWKPKK